MTVSKQHHSHPVVVNMRCCSSHFLRAQSDFFTLRLLFNQQSKILRLFIYCHISQRKAGNA